LYGAIIFCQQGSGQIKFTRRSEQPDQKGRTNSTCLLPRRKIYVIKRHFLMTVNLLTQKERELKAASIHIAINLIIPSYIGDCAALRGAERRLADMKFVSCLVLAVKNLFEYILIWTSFQKDEIFSQSAAL
jgi:hypothetical protein